MTNSEILVPICVTYDRRDMVVTLVAKPKRRGRKPRTHVSRVRIRGVRHDPPDAHKIAKVLVEIARSLDGDPDQDPGSPAEVLVSDPTCRDQTPDTDEPPTSA
jgi:hypothetical protein